MTSQHVYFLLFIALVLHVCKASKYRVDKFMHQAVCSCLVTEQQYTRWAKSRYTVYNI
jgi:hypothetical protein